jgi:hypothetical protein
MQAWFVLLALNVILVIAYLAQPLPRMNSDFDFGPLFSALFRTAVTVVLTLVTWLIYFICRFLFG